MKSRGFAYLLTILGFFGIAGLQHLYLGKLLKGILWLVTCGFFGIGTIIDLFTMGTQIDSYNTKSELGDLREIVRENDFLYIKSA